MDLSHPADDLFGRNTARVLQRLAFISGGMTGRRISELSLVPLGSTQRILGRLEKVGLITVQPVGRANVYSLNRSHLLWPVVDAAFNVPIRIEGIVAQIVRRHVGDSATVAVYGSFARGEAGPDSDLDILIVWRAELAEAVRTAALDELNERLESATGNRIEIVDLSLAELQRLAAVNDPLIDSWKREAKTLSAGPDIRALANGVAA